jgi:RNA polymerase sigma-70 factor (ECF subfamily)
LQLLPPRQRAVLILREVLRWKASEVAELLDTSVASVNSALQRARRAVDRRVPARSQQATLRALGEDRLRELVEGFVAAWERADVDAILGMLAEDARFTMPPLPSWFSGREDVGVFLAERVFATPWRLVPMRASAQPALAVYQGDPRGGRFRLSALDVLTLRGRQVLEITAFLHPAVHRRFGLPAEG